MQFLDNYIRGVNLVTFLIRIVPGLNASAHSNRQTFIQIFLYKLRILAKCNTENKVCSHFPILSIPSIQRQDMPWR